METIKITHIVSAYIMGIGFLVRGFLSVLQSHLLQHKLLKITPHIVDTFVLISGVTMVITLSLWTSSNMWLMAKIVALVIYIFFGMLMLRWGSSSLTRWLGFLGGLVMYFYIVGAAHIKSIQSFVGYFLALLEFNALVTFMF